MTSREWRACCFIAWAASAGCLVAAWAGVADYTFNGAMQWLVIGGMMHALSSLIERNEIADKAAAKDRFRREVDEKR